MPHRYDALRGLCGVLSLFRAAGPAAITCVTLGISCQRPFLSSAYSSAAIDCAQSILLLAFSYT